MCNSILESLKNLYNCHSEHCEESIAESLIDPLAKLQDDLSNLWQLRIREGKFTGEFMVEIITKGDNLAYQKELTKLFKDNFPQVKSLYHTISERNDLRGAKRRLLLGSPIIYEKIGKFTYQVSPESFFQTNSLGVRNLYEKIKEFAEIKMGDRILDLYCGTGTIGIYLSTLAKKVIGVEIVQSAINDAKANAKINNVINCEFICADANVFLSSRAIDRPPIGGMNQGERSPYNGTNDSLIQNLNAIIVDPPRDGLDKKIIPIVSGLLTPNSKLIYVSCNPTTFARDIKLFEENGLKLKKVQPIDMFPQTHHIECIGLLKKTKAADRLTNQKAR
jgi:23S rRNA (uracil1939-C5)-methyltransferase